MTPHSYYYASGRHMAETELAAIHARQRYGIERANDSNREGELLAKLYPFRTALRNFALYTTLVGCVCLKLYAISQLF